MTIPPTIGRAVIALSLAGSLAACASRDSLETRLGATDRSVTAAQEALDEFDQRIASVEDAVESQRALKRRLRAMTATIVRLRERLAELRSSAAAASDEASQAVGTASQVSRSLAVLENRFDYHLRSHGGS